MSITAIDAFCGAGGLSLGLSQAGFDVRLGFDNDPVSVKTQMANPFYFAHPVLEADIRDLTGKALLEMLGLEEGELDLLAGGPPCQGFSVQRTIGDDSDDRNLLVHEYGDLICELRPRFFLMENVSGIGGKRGRETLKRFCSDMARSGYFVHEATVDAQHYGVPQRRRRVVVVGERLDLGLAVYQWPAQCGLPAPTVRETIGHLPEPPNDGSDHPGFPGHRRDRLSDLNKKRLRALSDGQDRTNLPQNLLAECHLTDADVIGHRGVYGRMAWDEVAPTITARFDSFTRGKFGHPEQVRTVSLHEGALLQTFPPDFVFVGSKVEVARQIGNAVPPRLAEAIGRAIGDALEAAIRA